MSKIKILPEILSNKIAAGEVVERPSSVVKELVENALDANSTRIIVEVEKGGRSLIRVSDNGEGMGHDDALLAIERYATSKIYKDQDLFSIKTLGFRGEALPSIASVSRFSLVTRDKKAEAGTEIIVEGGKIKNVSNVGAPTGTMITVKQLFFNTPARRKFLKTINTEMGHIADTMANIALGWPRVQFKLLHNAKIVKSWSLASDHVDRVADVLGKGVKDDLHRIQFDESNLSVTGWISDPGVTRSTSQGIYLYVNGRFVRDRIIQHALLSGYTSRLMKGRFPVAALFINLPFDHVDVNVHPTKHEVRFAEQKGVHDAVVRAVSETLHLADQPKWAEVKLPEENQTNTRPYVSEAVSRYREKGALHPGETGSAFHTAGMKRKDAETNNQQPATSNQKKVLSKQTPLWETKRFGDLRIIGQFHNTYILCESDEGLILIDQHAAHERVLFERLKNRSLASKNAAQKLLIPETIDLGYREAEILEKLIPDLNKAGLEIEPFGGNTFVIKSLPILLAERQIKALVIEIIEKMVEIGFTPGLEKSMDQCLILMACHGAIRANQHLSDKQIKGLLSQLDECENPSHCPHGRPTWIKWTTRFLEKSFNRIVS